MTRVLVSWIVIVWIDSMSLIINEYNQTQPNVEIHCRGSQKLQPSHIKAESKELQQYTKSHVMTQRDLQCSFTDYSPHEPGCGVRMNFHIPST